MDMGWIEDLGDLYIGLIIVPTITAVVLFLGVFLVYVVLGGHVDRNVRLRGI